MLLQSTADLKITQVQLLMVCLSKVDKVKDYVLGQKTLKEKVASALFKENVKAFESSAENAKRSIAVFYSSGVMGNFIINEDK